MAQSNKILTVSYGTFSCTLEGFDNPFGTMQSIAEYFRDLAAEDRYFGAEPPQPDAQMLHQIAEREVRRRVEARVEDKGVVLRQMTEADETAPQPSPPAAAAPESPKPESEREAEAQEPEVEETEAAGSESVAERLARIRAVVAKARAQRDRTYEEDEQVVDDRDESLLTAFAEAEDAEISEEDDFAAETSVDDDSEPSRAAADTLDEPDDRASDEAAPDAAEPEVTAPIPGAQQVGAAEGVATVAAGLATEPAHRAELDPAPPEAAEERGAKEASLSPDVSVPTAAAMVDLDDAEEELPASWVPELSPDDATIDEVAAVAPESGFDKMAAAEAEAPAAAEEPASAASEAPTDETAEDVELADLMSAIASAGKSSSEQQDEPSGQGAADEAAQAGDEDDAWVEVEVEDDDGVPRIVRMSRTEFEEALANGDLEEIEEVEGEVPEANTEEAIRGIFASTDLTDADASALAAELAAVEQEGAPTAADPDSEEEAEPAQDKPSGEQTVTRLLDETNAQMGEPEGHRRRSAIQHLRAAVAATKADDRLRDRSLASDASIARFRDDLQKAVRPRRPGTEGEPARAPGGPGPLVLVSSQRVDSVRPVRPLRGASTPVAPVEVSRPAEKQSFVDFAAKLGARELPDLLEAAAAYSKIVEGQDGAPRPVLLRRVTEAAPEGSATREEGLKSLGQLLRSGRIRKVEHGRFALAEDAELATKARIAN
ncbi:hypothetical protein [Palleronia sp.]|uniref:hypothetical protein n=1 Tax=Palleronia sp. TaxID=1940284 RepID=UPI0035C7C7A3